MAGEKKVELSHQEFLRLIDALSAAVKIQVNSLQDFTLRLNLELLVDKCLANPADFSPQMAIAVLNSIHGCRQFVGPN